MTVLVCLTMAYQVRNFDHFLKFQLTGLQLNEVNCMQYLHVQCISLNQTSVNQTFRKWVGCEYLAPIQDNSSLSQLL